MKKYLTLEDVLILPQFSDIKSRKDVDTRSVLFGLRLETPIISSNMDTITGTTMAVGMSMSGAVGCLHRFTSVDNNIRMFEQAQDAIFNSSSEYHNLPMVSVGIGDAEFERAKALLDAGANNMIIDVAHGASQAVVEMYDRVRFYAEDRVNIIVGNFATANTINEFNSRVKSKRKPDAFKVGVGNGAMCTTRIVTGCGVPLLSSIQDCATTGHVIIADGGISSPGDLAKVMAAGASAVMMGSPFAGTDQAEAPVTVIHGQSFKQYRGSASAESYAVQGKLAAHRTPEGESTLVPLKGSVRDVIQEYNAGLRSAMTYVGAKNLTEFKERARFIEITPAGWKESKPHGKSS